MIDCQLLNRWSTVVLFCFGAIRSDFSDNRLNCSRLFVRINQNCMLWPLRLKSRAFYCAEYLDVLFTDKNSGKDNLCLLNYLIKYMYICIYYITMLYYIYVTFYKLLEDAFWCTLTIDVKIVKYQSLHMVPAIYVFLVILVLTCQSTTIIFKWVVFKDCLSYFFLNIKSYNRSTFRKLSFSFPSYLI